MAYAYGDGVGAGKRLGLSRAVSTLGPVVALGAGGYLVTLVGPQQVFVIYGLIGLLALGLAWRLPPLDQAAEGKMEQAPNLWIPSAFNVLIFMVALGADGVFTATLSILLAEVLPVSSALIGAGLLLAFHRAVVVVLALASGSFVDRFDATRLLAPTSLAIVCGLAAIALGWVYAGALILICARAVLGILAPMVAVKRAPGDRMGAMASYATWSDTGLALGPLVGTVAVTSLGFAGLYGALAAAVLACLIWVVITERRTA